MSKKLNNFLSFFAAGVLCFFAGSCIAPLDPMEEVFYKNGITSSEPISGKTLVQVTGNLEVSLTGAYPKEIVDMLKTENDNSKSAVPGLTGSVYYYQIKAVKLDETLQETDTVVYTKCDDNKKFVLYLPNDPGKDSKWKLIAQGFNSNEIDISTGNYKSEKQLLEGVYSDYIEVGETNPSMFITTPIILTVKEADEGKGSVNLRIRWNQSVEITKIKYDFIGSNALSAHSGVFDGLASSPQSDDDTNYYYDIKLQDEGSGIDNRLFHGVYSLKLDFFIADEIVYSLTEKVVVCTNYETNTWVCNSGNRPIYMDAGTDQLVITQFCLDTYKRSTFYISNNGDDNNDGSFDAPFETFLHAILYIDSLPAGKDYTIYVIPDINGKYEWNATLLGKKDEYATDNTAGLSGSRRVYIKGYSSDNSKVKIKCVENQSLGDTYRYYFLSINRATPNDDFIFDNFLFNKDSPYVFKNNMTGEGNQNISFINCDFDYENDTTLRFRKACITNCTDGSHQLYIANCNFKNINGSDSSMSSYFYFYGFITLKNCTFENIKWLNSDSSMIEIENCGGLTIEDCKFINNIECIGNSDGKISLLEFGQLTNNVIKNCEFSGNEGQYISPIYCKNASLTVIDTKFSSNKKTGGNNMNGGAINIVKDGNGVPNVTICGNTQFIDCETTSDGNYSAGGAIYSENATLVIKDNVKFNQNKAGYGSAICIKGGNATIKDNVTFNTNNALSYSSDSDKMTGTICVLSAGSLTIGEEGASNLLSPSFTSNTSAGPGGTIDIRSGTLTFNSGIISGNTVTGKNNTADFVAGAIYSDISANTININGGQIINNRTTETTSGGANSHYAGIITRGLNMKGNFEIYGTYFDSEGTPVPDILLYNEGAEADNNHIKITGPVTSSVTAEKKTVVDLVNETDGTVGYKYDDSKDIVLFEKGTGTPAIDDNAFADAVSHFKVNEGFYLLKKGENYSCFARTNLNSSNSSINYADLEKVVCIDDGDGLNTLKNLLENNSPGSDFTDKTIVLNTDISSANISVTKKNEGYYNFNGTFDGNGHSITLTEDCFRENGQNSIFGSVGPSGVIKNLNLEGNINKITRRNTYLFCEELCGGTIENCINKCNIVITGNNSIGDDDDIAGIVGKVTGGGVVKNCRNEGNFTGGQMAGICHQLENGKIINCVNKGNITSQRETYTGGIVRTVSAVDECYIINCCNEGNITGDEKCGGILGEAWGSGGIYIVNCYNNAVIKIRDDTDCTNPHMGGIVGELNAAVKMANCYSELFKTSSYRSSDEVAVIGNSNGMSINQDNFKFLCGRSGDTTIIYPCENNTISITGYSYGISTNPSIYNAHFNDIPSYWLDGVTLEPWVYDTRSGYSEPTFQFVIN